MKLFTDQKEPLFGRADIRIHLKPFETTVLKEILTDNFTTWTNDDLLALFTITGGVARYVEIAVQGQNSTVFSIEDLYKTVISESSFFIDEGNALLISEFGKQYKVYYSILSCIARGVNAQNEIQQMMGETSIGGYLKHLVEKYEVISKLHPIHSGSQTKKVKYRITNPFLNFWFRYIDRYRSTIEIGNYEALMNHALGEYKVYSGIWLEAYFRQKLAEQKNFTQIGQWWNNQDGQDEIDIVAENEFRKKVLFAEVKRNPKKFQREKFQSKVDGVKIKYYRDYEVCMSVLSLEDM